MLDSEIIKNWLKIINYNSKVEILEDKDKFQEIVRIPLTPINLDAGILYQIFKSLYPIFINDQQNILDLIISDDANEVLDIFLYETRYPGVHESFQKIPTEIIEIPEEYIKSIDEFFHEIQLAIVKNYGLKISTLRIFKKEAINEINEYSKHLPIIANKKFMIGFLNLVQKLVKEDLIYIFPKPNLFKFLKGLTIFLNGFQLSSLFKFFLDILPEANTSIFLNSQEINLIFLFIKDKSDIQLKLKLPEEFGININEDNPKEILDTLKKQSKSASAFFLNQSDIISILLNLFELDFPLDNNKIELLMQKVLFGLRNHGNFWYVIPRPLVYNNVYRFFLRMLGLNINLKKLSHWAIPDLLFNMIETNFGMNSRILIILTSINKKNYSRIEYIKNAFTSAFIIEIENKKLVKLIPLKKNDIISEEKINDLDEIRNKVAIKYGYLSAAINIDRNLLNKLIPDIISNINGINPFLRFKTFKMLEKTHYFNMYPETSIFRFLKNKGMKKLFKLLLPVIIDKHEF
ncbi:MAG: hypothetical protein EU539_11540 [Promethearchaeota archaeon]|nr:MAG: hypothetical protein EU539_11540 [Candidatus Lokiarchaeota archaeon]